MPVIFLTPDEIAKYVYSVGDDRVNLVTFPQRVGVNALCAAMEWYWYKPGTPESDLYQVNGARWEGLTWLIITMTRNRLEDARDLAGKIGLRFANGVPAVLVGTGFAKGFVSERLSRLKGQATMFPGGLLADGTDNLSMFAVESNSNSPVADRRRALPTQVLEDRDIEINDMFNKGRILTPEQIVEHLYGAV
jgi:hypothetical protein